MEKNLQEENNGTTAMENNHWGLEDPNKTMTGHKPNPRAVGDLGCMDDLNKFFKGLVRQQLLIVLDNVIIYLLH